MCVFVSANLSTRSFSFTSRYRTPCCFGICPESLEVPKWTRGKREPAQKGTPDQRKTCFKTKYCNLGRDFHLNVKQFHILKHIFSNTTCTQLTECLESVFSITHFTWVCLFSEWPLCQGQVDQVTSPKCFGNPPWWHTASYQKHNQVQESRSWSSTQGRHHWTLKMDPSVLNEPCLISVWILSLS